MAETLRGKPVADALNARTKSILEDIMLDGLGQPEIVVVRIGCKPDDVAYERSIERAAAKVDMGFRHLHLPEDIGQGELIGFIDAINADDAVSGCIVMRPLPSHIDEMAVCDALDPKKDIDGIGAKSLAGIFMGTKDAFAPATASACLDMLDYYGIALDGKRVVVVGRSLVIGKPVGMLFLDRNATVTYCHSKTSNLKAVTSGTDIVVAAIGKPKALGEEFFASGQVVLDVGINVDDEGAMCGDVDYDAVSAKVASITPVPGGIGSVTTAQLLQNAALAYLR